MVYDLENAMSRLKRIDELADNQSQVVTSHVPHLVQLLEMTHEFIEHFRSKL